MHDILKHTAIFVKSRFMLHLDKEAEMDLVETIRGGIVFRGTKLWILIFAILLASIGLNVNSTAVIIGAMLISPLMGPIVGIGLGLGLLDFEMLKHAAKNLAIMVIISLAASVLYFSLSPINVAQSELLSRTTPTIWDVLIAFFGGLAGIVAGAFKGKGTVIPGVAIATALMPPLCTAGYGIAVGDFYFFIGAFYLFCINTVFISVSTFIVVRLLKFTKHKFLNTRSERRVRNLISGIVLITVVPSILIAYLTVKKAVFDQRALNYVKTEFLFEKTIVITQRFDYENAQIDIVLLGEVISNDSIQLLKDKAQKYNLQDVNINITQGINQKDKVDVNVLRAGIVEELYSKNEKLAEGKDEVIQTLLKEIEELKSGYPVQEIGEELIALNPSASSLSIDDNIYFDLINKRYDTITIARAKFLKHPSKSETITLQSWLKTRTKSDSLILVVD